MGKGLGPGKPGAIVVKQDGNGVLVEIGETDNTGGGVVMLLPPDAALRFAACLRRAASAVLEE